MENIFLKSPPKIHILGVNDETFYLKSTVVFIGGVDAGIKKAIKSKNATLAKYYGAAWKEKLGFTNSSVYDLLTPRYISHGSDEIEDIMNFDTEFPEMSKPKADVKAKTNAANAANAAVDAADAATKTKAKTNPTASLIFVDDVHIYPEDKVSELKEKISLATGIAPYKQHLFFRSFDDVVSMRYKIESTEYISTDIRKLYMRGMDKIKGIPVSRPMFESKHDMKIIAYDQFSILNSIYQKYGTSTYYMVDVDEFFEDERGEFAAMTKSDVYKFELVYYSFVMRYFPMMTIDVFSTYLRKEADVAKQYPLLAPARQLLAAKYGHEKAIIDDVYATISRADFAPFRPMFPINSGQGTAKDAIAVSVRTAVLSVGTQSTQSIRINIRNLFDELVVGADMPFVSAQIWHESEVYEISKIVRDVQFYDSVKYQLTTVPDNIVIVVRASGKYIVLSIHANGKYHIRSSWEESDNIGFNDIRAIAKNNINPVIKAINAFGRSVFNSLEQLPLYTPTNSEFTGMTISIIWKKQLSDGEYNRMLESMSAFVKAEMISQKEVVYEGKSQKNEYSLYKSVSAYNPSAIERYVVPSNYYEYASNADFKQKWDNLFGGGRVISFSQRATDIKIDVENIRQIEFRYFFHYITYHLYRFSKTIKASSSSTGRESNVLHIARRTNLLKLLKAKDPEAFDFKRFGSDKVYSRICQKNHQPIPYTLSEYHMLAAGDRAKAIKYWNFTTETEMYYLCPNPKYPFLSFITGHHPKGYCLPCCKKTPSGLAKKHLIQDTCMKHHKIDETTAEGDSKYARYVMNYGKELDSGRIGFLPDLIAKYLSYNLQDVDILSDFSLERTFTMDGRIYSVDRLFKITKSIKVYKLPIAELTKLLNVPVWENKNIGVGEIAPIDVINNPDKTKKHQKHYRRILTSDMSYPILLYRDSAGWQVIIDGMHRLSKAYIQKHETIDVKFVTAKQLDKVMLPASPAAPEKKSTKQSINFEYKRKRKAFNELAPTVMPMPNIVVNNSLKMMSYKRGAGVITMDEKKPGHYILGVVQSNANTEYVGLVYALAAVFNMEFNSFIMFIIKILSEDRSQYFSILLKGTLNRYFASMDDLIAAIKHTFGVKSGGVSSEFTDWNRLFIDITFLCLDKNVILIEDMSVVSTGTSNKPSESGNIHLISPFNIRHIDELFPADGVSGGSAKARHNLARAAPRTQKMAPAAKVASIIGDISSQFILILQRRKKSKSTLVPDNYLYYPIMVFSPYNYFKTGVVEKRVFSMKDEIIKLLRSIVSEKIQQTNPIASGGIFDRFDLKLIAEMSQYNIDTIYVNNKQMAYAIVLDTGVYIPIIESHYNETIAGISHEPFIRKGSRATFDALMKFIKVFEQERSVVMKWSYVLAMNGVAVGLIDYAGYSYYFENTSLKHVLSIITAPIKELRYDPDVINALINKNVGVVVGEISRYVDPNLARAQAGYKLYDNFVYNLISYFDIGKNADIRSRITREIKSKHYNPRKAIEALSSIVADYPADYERLRMKITDVTDRHELLDDIDKSHFIFDKKTLHTLIKISTGYQHADARARETIEKNMIASVKAFANKAGVAGKMNSTITKSQLKEFSIAFAHDFLNPLKGQFIVSLILSNEAPNYFQFRKNPGESIFVKKV